MALFILGSLLEGIAPDIYFFLIARILMGVGAGGMGSLPYVIADWFQEKIRPVILAGVYCCKF